MKKYIVPAIMIAVTLVLAVCGRANETLLISSNSTIIGDMLSENQESPKTQKFEADKPIYSLKNAIIVDDENCTFTIIDIKENGFMGVTLNVLCENKTAGELMFVWDEVSVNGYMVHPFWAHSVAAGKKSIDEISFSNSNLKRCNITSVDEIVFTLRVYDNDDWYADNLVDDEFVVYPTGLDANSVVYPERSISASEQVIIDNESCIFIIESVETDAFRGYTINCYLENKTSDWLLFLWDDVSVNGYMVDPYWADSVAAGKKSYAEIYFVNDELERCNITSVDEIVFVLIVDDYDDRSADYLVEDEFAVYPTGLDANSVVYPKRSKTATEQIVIDNESCIFIIESVEADAIRGYTLNCYLENKTSDWLVFRWDDVSVNGYMLDPFWTKVVQPGKRVFSDIRFNNSSLESIGISEVEEIEYILVVHNYNDWTVSSVVNEAFTYVLEIPEPVPNSFDSVHALDHFLLAEKEDIS